MVKHSRKQSLLPRKKIVDSTSFTKTVKFSIEICSKMILIGNYTCSLCYALAVL